MYTFMPRAGITQTSFTMGRLDLRARDVARPMPRCHGVRDDDVRGVADYSRHNAVLSTTVSS